MPDTAGVTEGIADDIVAAYTCYAGSERAPLFRWRTDELQIADNPIPADALVAIATIGSDPHATARIRSNIALLRDRGVVREGARCYLVALCEHLDDGAARAVAEVRAVIEAVGLIWSGGVAAEGMAALPRLLHSPRLGRFRRPLSRALDSLIAAVRLGCAMDDLPRVLGTPAPTQAVASTSGRGGDAAHDGRSVVPRPLLYRWFARP